MDEHDPTRSFSNTYYLQEKFYKIKKIRQTKNPQYNSDIIFGLQIPYEAAQHHQNTFFKIKITDQEITFLSGAIPESDDKKSGDVLLTARSLRY